MKKYYHATNYANFSGIMAKDVIKAGIDGGVFTFVILQKMLVSSWLFEERR